MATKKQVFAVLKKTGVFTLFFVGGLSVVIALISLLYNSGLWVFRAFNFPRIQTFVALMVCLLVCLVSKPKGFRVFSVCLGACLAIQGYILYPYTSFAKEQIASADATAVNPQSVFSILVANVLQYNTQTDSLLSIIHGKDPTFVLLMGTNRRWVKAVNNLSKSYPHQILYPTNNTYGMCPFSKLPLKGGKIYFLNHDSVPSFHVTVALPNSAAFQLFTLHPVVPKPSEQPDNVGEKEVALLRAAQIINRSKLPALAAGDFNDVGWSHNLKVFEKISGLKDLRCGRGFYNTFDATSVIMHWPLDYVFADVRFKVIHIQRLPAFGSDHFPYYAQLSLEK